MEFTRSIETAGLLEVHAYPTMFNGNPPQAYPNIIPCLLSGFAVKIGTYKQQNQYSYKRTTSRLATHCIDIIALITTRA